MKKNLSCRISSTSIQKKKLLEKKDLCSNCGAFVMYLQIKRVGFFCAVCKSDVPCEGWMAFCCTQRIIWNSLPYTHGLLDPGSISHSCTPESVPTIPHQVPALLQPHSSQKLHLLNLSGFSSFISLLETVFSSRSCEGKFCRHLSSVLGP